MKSIFTEPKLSKAAKGWFVHYRYDGKQFRETMGYNKIADLRKRELEYNQLCSVILNDLKKGWNPNIVQEEFNDVSYNIMEAIEFGLQYKKDFVSKATHQDYSASMKRIKSSIVSLNVDLKDISELTKKQVRIILNKTQEAYGVSDHTYNKLAVHFKAVLTPLVDQDLLEVNPVIGIKAKKILKQECHTPASAEDMEKIKEEILKTFPYFFNFISTMFHTGIRVEELLKVQLYMIDVKNKEITLPPPITKNRKGRIVPINAFVVDMFNKLKIDLLPSDYYLFGTPEPMYIKNRNRDTYFTPYINKIRRREATALWRVIVKDKLKIDMNLYAIKKHGANEKILAGLSISALKELFGHSSEFTTAIYITKLKEINRKEIIDKSPDF